MELPWAALSIWAVENAVLERLGFQRGFLRTEIAPWNGRAVAVDSDAPVSNSLTDV